jgi:hypothetical protein
MVAAPRLRRRENTFKPDLQKSAFPALLKVAAIYGANASGKSNLVAAVHSVVTMANLESRATPERLPVDSFRFDSSLSREPSRFEVNFIAERQRYEFELHATQDRIEFESLIAYPNGKATPLYSRSHRNGRDNYEFGPQLEGSKDLHETWSKSTGPARLFLSQAVANSSEELRQLRAPFEWLSGGGLYEITGVGLGAFARRAQSFMRDNPSIVKRLTTFIRDLDIPVVNMQFEPAPPLLGDALAGSVNTIDGSLSSAAAIRTTFTHKTALGEASFDFDDESTGTQNLIGFFLPWMVLSTDKPAGWRALVLDELDSSLHPKIIAELIRRHLRSETHSQLIFTTHDTHLMDTRQLRRDQIWLTERDKNGATLLRAVHEFEGRESEDLEKRYYEGRYRGLPILRSE